MTDSTAGTSGVSIAVSTSSPAPSGTTTTSLQGHWVLLGLALILGLVAAPSWGACKTCTPQNECVTTENAGFCSCEEKIWGQGERCIPKLPMCFATNSCCCGGPDDIPVKGLPARTIAVSSALIHSLMDEVPHLGHALDTARVNDLDLTASSPADPYGTAKRANLSPGWHAGTVGGPNIESFIFSMKLEAEGDGGQFHIEIRRYDRETLMESLTYGSLVEIIDGNVGADGVAAVIGGEVQSWSAQD